jgi:hypothetical protein
MASTTMAVMTTDVTATGITGGVDTHLDVHVAAALDAVGGLLGTPSFPTTTAGYRALARWLAGFGPVTQVGAEGTSSYGSGLTRSFQAGGISVVERAFADLAGAQSRLNQDQEFTAGSTGFNRRDRADADQHREDPHGRLRPSCWSTAMAPSTKPGRRPVGERQTARFVRG